MNRIIPILIAAALLFGCAAGGGPVGTGISGATVSGNVVDVQITPAATTAGAATLPSIEVSIDEVPGLATEADVQGNFELSGDFSGIVTLRFTTPQYAVTEAIDVPVGSAVVLTDITLHPNAVKPASTRQLEFRGQVDIVDCEAGEILVHDNRGMGRANQFMVRTTTDTTIVDGRGQAHTCADIQVGSMLAVEGIVRSSDGTIVAVRITVGVSSGPGSGPLPTHPVHFSGVIADLDCGTGLLVLDNGQDGQTRLQLLRTTKITGMGNQRLQCTDLSPGNGIGGDGIIRLRSPGVIEVQTLMRRGGGSRGPN